IPYAGLPNPPATLVPYTTLFRSKAVKLLRVDHDARLVQCRQLHRALDDVGVENLRDNHVSDFGAHGFSSPLRFFHESAGQLRVRSEEHTSELQSRENLVCRLLLE